MRTEQAAAAASSVPQEEQATRRRRHIVLEKTAAAASSVPGYNRRNKATRRPQQKINDAEHRTRQSTSRQVGSLFEAAVSSTTGRKQQAGSRSKKSRRQEHRPNQSKSEPFESPSSNQVNLGQIHRLGPGPSYPSAPKLYEEAPARTAFHTNNRLDQGIRTVGATGVFFIVGAAELAQELYGGVTGTVGTAGVFFSIETLRNRQRGSPSYLGTYADDEQEHTGRDSLPDSSVESYFCRGGGGSSNYYFGSGYG
ncbi:hypothetical protein ACRALDRAFT_2016346 [Sodiomyces alcalophilus JCM 7366]|uniref:uncharacterized protein n=1 Tax=Sodiomyces alcalophilus JCM 7366 TaxID=591952 RepID=UPI0039B4AD8B